MLAPVLEARKVAAGVFSVWIRSAELAARTRPGHFLNVKVGPGADPLLRRPLSVADLRSRDLRLVYRVIGRGTEMLSRARKGDLLDVLGPLGKPAPLWHKRKVFVVGGGIGAAPLLLLARVLARDNSVQVFLGARSRSQLVLVPEFRALRTKLRLTTDDGSAGTQGTVVEIAESSVKCAVNPVVVACGPHAMLRDLVRRLDPIPVWGYVEERMGCGTGICHCCALPRKGGGYERFCQDGPVVLLNEAEL